MLAEVRAALVSGGPVAVQALRGMGGVGKTQIAIEYAHRHTDDYDVVWWLNAGNPALLGEQFAVLAADLRCVDPAAPLEAVQRAVLGELHRRPRWLLIFDNATQPGDVRGWLPGGTGHALITSRSYGWEEVAVPVDVDVLTRAESAAILSNRVIGLSGRDADLVADAVGDLPLAVAQAASYLAETKMRAGQYVALLKTRAADLLSEGKPTSYPETLAAVTRLAYDRLRAEDEQAADIAAVCAFLAPEPVPVDWLMQATSELPSRPVNRLIDLLTGSRLLTRRTHPPTRPRLLRRLADPVARSRLLTRLTRSSLMRLDPDGLTMHRLTQAILRACLPPDEVGAVRSLAEQLVVANGPGDHELPANWPAWARVLPHLLAVNPAVSDSQTLRDLAGRAAWFLTRRGDAHAAHNLANQLYERSRERLGPDHTYTLLAANILGQTLHDMGHYARARELDKDTMDRRRRLSGEHHERTLVSANNLAIDLNGLGEYAAARKLIEDVLAHRRRALGADHPSALRAAGNLAATMRQLGEYRAARELNEEVLVHLRRVLGPDHPDTLTTASNLSLDLNDLGEEAAARELIEDVLRRRRRVLGADHPDTLKAAGNLANSLYRLGEYEASRELGEDAFARFRQVLGQDHPETLTTADNLAYSLRRLGEHRAARELDEDTLMRRRRVLGEDHPHTRHSAANLAADLRALAEPEAGSD